MRPMRLTRFTTRLGVFGPAALLVGMLTACSAKSPERSQARPVGRPNIVIISLCSVRADHMNVYGYPRKTSPNLKRLADESIVFEHAITQWPMTVPAFAAIMSAKYGHTNGVMRTTPNQHLDDKHLTLAEVLGAHGYQTAAFVSAALSSKTNVAQGFDTIEELWRENRHPTIAPSVRSLEWLERHQGTGQPLFIWAHYNNAHVPYRGGGAPSEMFVDDAHYDPRRKIRIYRNRYTTLDLDVPQDHPCRRQILRPDVGGVCAGAILYNRPREHAYYVARYDSGIFGADLAVGMLFDGLREMGLLEHTIVALVGDHGDSLGEHNFYMNHGRFPYDATVRVPLMIRPAGGTEERRIDPPVTTFRLAPTLLEMAGLSPPKEWEATSLCALIAGQAEPEYVFTESGYQKNYTLAVRDDEWKLIYVPNEMDQSLQQHTIYELYNWRQDPAELENLIAQQPAVADHLKRVLHDWARPWIDEAYGRVTITKLDLDEATLKELAALGYIEATEAGADQGEAGPAATRPAAEPTQEP